MRILIAEDNDSKYQMILDCLTNEFGVYLEVKGFTYAKGVVLELMNNEYVFLIQDMQMPLDSDGRIDASAGSYVFSQLNRRQIKIKTICCSSEEVDLSKFPNYKSVLFSYSGCSWKEDLINKMKNY